ncbi:SDR family NAD(P)-dependent oxidoreductase [uncultured Lacinutrix sp.]|uniref:SDR family NAD(P)-dependent oxidoreductase n=1 Tax=uncultured Lacinutrix sp. TaxID=574032 RepID=UPI0026231E84|nr:SDR family NAD(P)-dependent oxidoreductase [uncultured Lacinutrix sp.]
MPNAIIFGATSGIGKTLIHHLIKDGYTLAITGRRLQLLQEIKTKHPDKIFIYQHDVQDIEASDVVFKTILKQFKTIDLVVHSSGVGYENPNLEWEKEYDTLKTNVIGATKIYDLVFNQFIKQKFGHLAAISSIASLRGNRGAPAYFASKAFQVNYLESLYLKTKEIKGGKIYITDIRPGFIDTKMALGDGIFWMAPLEKATKQIYRAIKRKKRRVYISRRWNVIAWVLKVVPSWLMKKVM